MGIWFTFRDVEGLTVEVKGSFSLRLLTPSARVMIERGDDEVVS